MDKITFKDWLFALIGLLFTLSGMLIIQKDFNTGITTLVFFGTCFAVAVHIIVRKLRLQRQSLRAVTVAGGEPIHASKKRIALLSLSCGHSIFREPSAVLLLVSNYFHSRLYSKSIYFIIFG